MTWLNPLHARLTYSPEEREFKSVPEFLKGKFEFAIWEDEVSYQKRKPKNNL